VSRSDEGRFLMCPPHHYGVEYVINPWMHGQVNAASQALATEQWRNFYSVVSTYADVALMNPVCGLPDLVFTANAALVYEQTAILSSFRCPERQPEAQHYADWLAADGFDVKTMPPGTLFEGAGDALFDRGHSKLLWFGYGYRSDETAIGYLRKTIGLEVQPLRLCDPRFYHLDTCFCPLEDGHLLYYAPAFDWESNRAIQSRVRAEKRFAVSAEDAASFACNAVNIERRVILNEASSDLRDWLISRGLEVIQTHMSEFMKAGGSTKCLSLRLDERV
jgi:N-dimethylarginine dimethylaminohydrolase